VVVKLLVLHCCHVCLVGGVLSFIACSGVRVSMFCVSGLCVDVHASGVCVSSMRVSSLCVVISLWVGVDSSVLWCLNLSFRFCLVCPTCCFLQVLHVIRYCVVQV